MSRSDALVPDDSLYDLAFDQFSRQYHMKQLIESVRPKRRLKILDVGGNNGKTREFFPRDEVMIADLYDIEEPGYTKASALDLPFADNSYDVVTCFDVFEHIEQKDRQQCAGDACRRDGGDHPFAQQIDRHQKQAGQGQGEPVGQPVGQRHPQQRHQRRQEGQQTAGQALGQQLHLGGAGLRAAIVRRKKLLEDGLLRRIAAAVGERQKLIHHHQLTHVAHAHGDRRQIGRRLLQNLGAILTL